MEVVFQDLSVQNLTCLTNHTAQQLVTDIKFNDPACFQRTFCTNITYQGHLLYEKKNKNKYAGYFPCYQTTFMSHLECVYKRMLPLTFCFCVW